MRKPITKKVRVVRSVCVSPLYQETYYELSSDLLEKHFIKRMNRKENIIPDNWKLNEEDFNLFMKEYDYGNGTMFYVDDLDLEYEEVDIDYMDEDLEMDDDVEDEVYDKFYDFLYGKGSKDEKTNTYLNIKKEEDRKRMEEWNKKVEQYEEVQ